MQSTKPTILCTGPVNESLLRLPAYNDVDIDVIPFTAITTNLTESVQQQIKETLKQTAVVVFTSSNAIKAVASYLEEQQPDWTIFCIGITTYELAKEYFGADKLRQTAENATLLADKVIANIATKEVTFFCGNLRRNELPDTLILNGIRVKEIVVYNTSLVPVGIEKKYDAVLFFSPSAAESFFTNNKLSGETTLFVMGNTTAAAIKKYADNKIIIGDEPSRNNLVNKAIRFVLENS